MVRAQVVTQWNHAVDAGGVQENGPALFPGVPREIGDTCADATGQPAANLPTSPNLLVVECVVSDATFAAILAHPGYGPGAVLWSETL